MGEIATKLLMAIRFAVGLVSTAMGYLYLKILPGLSKEWSLMLLVFGGFVIFLVLIEESISYTIRVRPVPNRLTTPDGFETTIPKFTFETYRQLGNWLIVASGVIIGLLTRTSVDDLKTVSALALGATILLGFIYTSVLVGGVHKEENYMITVGISNFQIAIFLLNTLFLAFLLGIAGLAVSLIP